MPFFVQFCDCNCVRVTTACIELIAGRCEFTVLYNRFGIRAEILISVETELAVFKGNKGNAACVRLQPLRVEFFIVSIEPETAASILKV